MGAEANQTTQTAENPGVLAYQKQIAKANLPQRDKALLYAATTIVNYSALEGWTFVDDLAHAAGMSRATAHRGLKDLRDQRLVDIREYTEYGKPGHNPLWLKLEPTAIERVSICDTSQNETRRNMRPQPSQFETPRVSNCDTSLFPSLFPSLLRGEKDKDNGSTFGAPAAATAPGADAPPVSRSPRSPKKSGTGRSKGEEQDPVLKGVIDAAYAAWGDRTRPRGWWARAYAAVRREVPVERWDSIGGVVRWALTQDGWHNGALARAAFGELLVRFDARKGVGRERGSGPDGSDSGRSTGRDREAPFGAGWLDGGPASDDVPADDGTSAGR